MSSSSPSGTALFAYLGPLGSHLLCLLILGPNFPYLYFLWQFIFALIYWRLFLEPNNNNDTFHASVSLRSLILGLVTSLGLELLLFHYLSRPQLPVLKPLAFTLIVFSLYHFAEFIAIALASPSSVTVKNFIFVYDFTPDLSDGPIGRFYLWLDRNVYIGADCHLTFALFFLEFVLETVFFPKIKFSQPWISTLGLLSCLTGEVIRKKAMLTAGRSFNHVVQETQKDDHTLVTEGIYSRWRHPSYTGLYFWYLGTQIILMNPIGCLLMNQAIQAFARRRIPREEDLLVEFFGKQYLEYREKVPSGVPGIP